MREAVRYCRRRGGMTQQWREGLGDRTPPSMALIALLLGPLLRLVDPWRCELCRRRDDDRARDDDD
jgi:hypothetical protein